MASLEENIGYKFTNSLLLAEALTHPSLAYETQKPHFDNQRLEFLGDAVLQLILTDRIFNQYQGHDEGEMTKLRSSMVSKEALHKFSKKIDLGEFVMMGKGEKANGGQNRASTLADGLEALLGAIYLDSGFAEAAAFIDRLIENSLEEAESNPSDKNPKGRLQEILQAIIPQSPSYEVMSESGPDHDKIFIVRILWSNAELASGQGPSKKTAEANAAEKALHLKLWKNIASPLPE